MILFLVREEITDFFEDINTDIDEHLLTMIDTGVSERVPVINYNSKNSTLYFSENKFVKELLGDNNIDYKNVLLVSDILSIGFLKLVKGYFHTIENTLLDN